MANLDSFRAAIRAAHLESESQALSRLTQAANIGADLRDAAVTRATALVSAIRADDDPGLMEVFLAEYGLSTDEGVALMCLAEALLRVPDADTMDELIEDKIAPSEWGAHLGHSSSSLVNASTWALMLTGKVLHDDHDTGIASTLRGMVKRLGEPVIRVAVLRAMKEMGRQFVLGENIANAMTRGKGMEEKGYTYSYDMLGEAALTARDARHFFQSYANAIEALARHAESDDIRENPGISVKLSALHPRYEELQRVRVMDELVLRVLDLARAAKSARIGFNIDAEEADRLELSLDVIEAVLRDPSLAGWEGFGVVVQAYGKRAGPVLDWLHGLAVDLDRRIMVRLVKGAYWDTEVKRAQVEGLPGFPVFTRKAATDVSYLCCARQLLNMTDRIYPQFATHNAHTVAAILEMADDPRAFEFQRLHGMGELLHEKVLTPSDTRCRIYAPVGAHRDLLAYLVRRLLENGANSSFVNQIVDGSVPPERVAADPFISEGLGTPSEAVLPPPELFTPERANSRGFDLHDPIDLQQIEAARSPFRDQSWSAGPMGAAQMGGGEVDPVLNPANSADVVGQITFATAQDVEAALGAAKVWDAPASERAEILSRAANLYEAHFGEFFALLSREAGKTLSDCVSELREAVDFLRYYAAQSLHLVEPPRGRLVCISPWNFPLAIFTGQIAAALGAGNAVLAKPAEATGLIAARAVSLLHEAGVPKSVLHLLPGTGPVVGAALTSDPRVDGVAFTGSSATGQAINRAMAENLAPDAPLIAETGGLNAMIVDSTALPEQAVRDIVTSAFQSAGQRCSALRVLYLQDDIAQPFLDMLYGAMDELRPGNPWLAETDFGPVIDAAAQAGIATHIDQARAEKRVLKSISAPTKTGHFVAPCVVKISGIQDLDREIFGPVLHVATFKSRQLDAVIDAINATGFGLTFGMHSRIDDRVEHVTSRISAGNLYVNRNQIGAVVGSQPFGGQGLSGTGPKAGGPAYMHRFCRTALGQGVEAKGPVVSARDVQRLVSGAQTNTGPLSIQDLPGPTGESNRLSTVARGVILCLGPDLASAKLQAEAARAAGCPAIIIAPGATGDTALDGTFPPESVYELHGFDGIAYWGPLEEATALRRALATRPGPLIPLLCEADLGPRCILERHLCIDTTAAGGNATLLAAVA